MARREAFKMFLKSGCEEEYRRRHVAIWPELKKLLSDGGVGNYSIYRDEDTNILFAYQEVEGSEGSQNLGANPIVKKWWDCMADLMEVNPDNSPVSIPLDEKFHMD
jgi:L-rhamnose 1-epimerase